MTRALIVGALLLWAPRAEATYSIAGVDTMTLEVGGAGTSCVGTFSVSVIYGSVPGAGVVHAQAYFNQAARDRAVELLGQGETAANVISEITSPAFDPNAAVRQYGVATVDGALAAFTGTGCDPWAGHDTGNVDHFAYTVQGNILTSENVVLNAGAAFEDPAGCDLADRLIRALEAGATNGEGDSRCTPDGIPSDGAFIRVDRPTEPGWLDLRVDNTAPMNPLVMLREQYDAWRATHACPAPPVEDAGVVDMGILDAIVGEDAEAAMDASEVADARMFADPANDEGCGCRAVGREIAPPTVSLVVVALLLARRRRR